MAHGIDHLVIACRDLDATADFYRGLGFQVGARNRHPWGTENHIVQLQGAFLELLALGPDFAALRDKAGAAPFADFLAAYLARREGFAMLVLESDDAAKDHAAFTAAGLVASERPFHFERRGRRPDGSEILVGFTLAFAGSPLISDAGFFVCQQHYPENFWNSAFQQHPNGAKSMLGVVLIAEQPLAHAAFFRGFAQSAPSGAGPSGVRFATARGMIDIVTPERFRADYGVDADLTPSAGPCLAAYRIGVDGLDALPAAGTLGRGSAHDPVARRILSAYGCKIIFEPL